MEYRMFASCHHSEILRAIISPDMIFVMYDFVLL